MERFPDGEIVVPAGLATDSNSEYYLKRRKEGSRHWIAIAAVEQGVTLEAAQARSLSPSEEAALAHFGGITKQHQTETGEKPVINMETWVGGASDAFRFMLNFWAEDITEYSQESGWRITDYGLEVLDALQQQRGNA